MSQANNKLPPKDHSGEKELGTAKGAHTFCIVQLSRFGDLLQTYQACLQFKAEFPHVTLLLVAREQFARPLEFLLRRVFEQIFFVNTVELRKDLAGVESATIFQENIKALLGRINQRNISVLANFTFSKTSGFLCGLIEADHKFGMTYDHPRHLKIKDNWGQFIYSNVMTGPLNPFNLVDLFRWILGSQNTDILVGLPEGKNHKKIFIHPFASHGKKAWNLNHWIEVIYLILKSRPEYQVVIIGSNDERAHSLYISQSPFLADMSTRLLNLVGQRSLETLYQEFSEAALFLGSDSMGGHFASLRHVPTITLSLGTTREVETVPYGPNNYVLSSKAPCFPCFPKDPCSNYICHRDIGPGLVGHLVLGILDAKSSIMSYLKTKVAMGDLEGCNIYRSEITATGLRLQTLTEKNISSQEVFRQFYNYAWKTLFTGEDVKLDAPKLERKHLKDLEDGLTGLELLFELNEHAQLSCQDLLKELESATPNLQQIRQFMEKLKEIDELGQTIKTSFPYTAPLVNFFQLKKANLAGQNLAEITQYAIFNHHKFSLTTSMLYELIQKALQGAKAKLGVVADPGTAGF